MANQTNRSKQFEPGTLAFLVIFGVFLCALGITVLLSVFGMQGMIFKEIAKVVGGLFGCLGFGMGILLIWIGVLVVLSSGRKMSKRELLFALLLYLCVLALFDLFSHMVDNKSLLDEAIARNNARFIPNADSFFNMLPQVYMLSSTQGFMGGTAGGAVGMVLAWPLWKYLGMVPASIILVALSILSILFLLRFDPFKLGKTLMTKREARQEEERQRMALEEQQRRQYAQQMYIQQNSNMPVFNGQTVNPIQGMPMQQSFLGYTMPPAYPPAAQQNAACNPYGQPVGNVQQPLIPEGMVESPQGELYDEIIFPETSEPTWKKKKPRHKPAKEEEPDPRSRWTGFHYTLGSTPKPISMEDMAIDEENQLLLSRSRQEAVKKMEQLRRRKQVLTERLESDRLAVEERRRTSQLSSIEETPAVDRIPEEELVLEPIYEQEPEEDIHSAYRRPEVREQSVPSAEPAEEEIVVLEEAPVKSSYVFPPIDFLKTAKTVPSTETRQQDEENALRLENTLNSFSIPAKVQRVTHGPSVTRFELGLVSSGINVKKILSIADNIALDMAANGPVRFEVPIKGTTLFGIEIPNQEVQTITLREVLLSEEMKNAKGKLVVALGKDVAGKPVLCDLARMPHLLIAGQTGSGKSVCINTIINSLLYRTSPEEVKLILIDPKVVELQGYNVIPHLLVPVVSDPMKAAGALTWALGEMQDRYRKMKAKKVRELTSYNAKLESGEPKLPRIVIIIDELADLMMVSKKAVEEAIIRLAQLARAAGIHLIVATQRPTVDVVTGLIKSNIPSRIAFSVSSYNDSRIIMDQGGAETLLGHGDMFYAPTGVSAPIRVQGCFISDEEIESITDYIAAHSRVEFDDDVIEALENSEESTIPKEDDDSEEGVDERLAEAIEMVIGDGQASISMLQRRMKVGYARAGRLIDEMTNRGIISRSAGSKPREVLISREEYERIKDAL